MSMANLDSAPAPKKGPSLVVQVGVLLAMTLLAVGGGWFAGAYLRAGDQETHAEAVKVIVEPMTPDGEGESADGHGGGHGGAKEEAHGDGEVKLIPRLIPLEPVTTNLAAPSDMWVRMELSVIFASPPPPDLPRVIHQDMLAYMRTVTLQQVEGASGFQHLKTDLEERARIRSGGLATQIMIRTLLFE